MSTRSNIAIRLRSEDRNKTFNTPWGEPVKPNGAEYLCVYCHNDGYPSGVGADLESMFNGGDYEEALDYILQGDRSTTDLSYWGWRREHCAPTPEQTAEDCYCEEYLYIIFEDENGELTVKQYVPAYTGSDGELGETVEDYFDGDILTDEDEAFEQFTEDYNYEYTPDQVSTIMNTIRVLISNQNEDE